MVANLAQKIDTNRILELTVTDVGGMVLPRTAIEYNKRGPDMGRETLIREISGTLVNVFFAGWLGTLGFMLFNSNTVHRMLRLNPLGVHTGAWINAKSLQVFGEQFEDALKAGKTPAQVREKWIDSILDSIVAQDAHVGHTSLHNALDKVSSAPLRQALHASVEGAIPQSGRLTPKAKKMLKQILTGQNSPWAGVVNTQEAIARFASEETARLKANGLSGEVLNHALESAVRSKRIEMSAAVMKAEAPVLEALEKAALQGGLSEKIHLLAGDRAVLSDKALKPFFQEVKAFLEQYMDRVLVDSQGKITNRVLHAAEKGRMSALMNGSTVLPGLKKAIMGLIPYTYKVKRWVSAVAVFTTLVVGFSVAFFNNWLTKKKHGGLVFSPAEGGPPPEAQGVSAGLASGSSGSNTGLYSGRLVRHNMGFAPFMQRGGV